MYFSEIFFAKTVVWIQKYINFPVKEKKELIRFSFTPQKLNIQRSFDNKSYNN